MRCPRRPPKRTCRQSSPNTVATPTTQEAMSIDSSVSDADAAADPIDVDKEQPAESQAATLSASGGPAGANTNQEEMSRAQ
ncbi:hypothetical protein PCASD_00098 [Puccinia coronata f. sp. avenae]|uniref:Uncharacterized protein n=1 Tax=Puccinia coronata f. sp. avenae TaxID=200324 RepID=A0A2N5VQU1_9BASI|nr:hypothetical protein PCASD_00098 [Puccinia coronata f. sp. avenae]